MTKAVLRARWCTNRWAVELSQSLLRSAMDRLSHRTDLNIYVQKVLRQYESDCSTSESSRYYNADDSRRNQVAVLECYFPLYLEFTTTEDGSGIFFADDTDDENTVTLFEFTMTFGGAGAERHQRLQSSGQYAWNGPKPDDEPFSSFMTDIIANTVDVTVKQRDEFWTPLSCIYTESVDDPYGGECERLQWRFNFRQKVAVDYLLSPESLPFQISSEIFRRAIKQDLTAYSDPAYYGISSYEPRYIHHLFEIDPTSMPREEPSVLHWASRACERIRAFAHIYQQERVEQRRVNAYSSEFSLSGRSNTRTKQVLAKYTFDVEVRMIRYLKTGEPPYSLNHPAPHLHNAITQLGEILGPEVDMAADDEEPLEGDSSDEEELPIEHYSKGPNPPELGFLHQDDYRGSTTEARDETEDGQASISSSPQEDDLESAYPGVDTKPSGWFENGSFAIEVLKGPAESVRTSLDSIALQLREGGRISWLSADDCKIPAQFVADYKWYKAPRQCR